MSIKVGINGVGRIGRTAFHASGNHPEIEHVGRNHRGPAPAARLKGEGRSWLESAVRARLPKVLKTQSAVYPQQPQPGVTSVYRRARDAPPPAPSNYTRTSTSPTGSLICFAI